LALPAFRVRLPRIVRPTLALSSRVEQVSPALSIATTPAARGVDWAQALRDYLDSTTSRKRGPFEMPRFPKRPPSVLALPERMRLSSGGEIDRIGKHCYAVSSDITYNPEASPDPGFARYMHSIQSLFAHEVPCDSGANKTWGEDFLEHLSRLGYKPPKP
ncbi:MAG: hypothetical protein ACRES7_11065, partial [Gammaproteobacteria bacterium]